MMRVHWRHMLVAHDLSEPSNVAWKEAVRLARRVHAKVEVVFVNENFPSVVVGGRPIRLTKSLERKIRRGLRSRVGPFVPIDIREGLPAREILRAARARRAGLIVLGTRGRAGLEHALLGSVAEIVVKRSPVPVLTVRRARTRLRSMLIWIDEDNPSPKALGFAADLAVRLGIPLRAVTVENRADRRADAGRLLESMVGGLPAVLRKACRLRPKVLDGNAAKSVLKEAGRHDLLVIVARREILFREILLGNVTDRILQLSAVPVLSLPPAAHRRL